MGDEKKYDYETIFKNKVYGRSGTFGGYAAWSGLQQG